MDLMEFRDFCLALGDVTEKMPFGKFAKRYDSILVFYVLDHMFCMVDVDDFSYATVKSTPEEIEHIRATKFSVDNPTNQSLKHWIQLNFHGDIPAKDIYAYVRRSFELVKQKYSKKR